MRSKTLDPILLFEKWFEEARAAGHLSPETMTLATATQAGKPSARMVLLKNLSRGAFVFFTNYESRKAQELATNPHAALIFYWERTQKQVRVEGKVLRVSKAESDTYFASRDRGSQIGAWASNQSRPLSTYDALENAARELEKKYHDRPIPRPPHWGGYRIVPEVIEFWQGREHRLHERTRFTRAKGQWKIETLAP
jgi:pyridoxamine 5'-phosphate oxidase